MKPSNACLGLLDALLGECPHFRGNLETIGDGHVYLLLVRVDPVDNVQRAATDSL